MYAIVFESVHWALGPLSKIGPTVVTFFSMFGEFLYGSCEFGACNRNNLKVNVYQSGSKHAIFSIAKITIQHNVLFHTFSSVVPFFLHYPTFPYLSWVFGELPRH